MSNKEVELYVRYILGKIPFNLQLTQVTWLLTVGFLLSSRGVLRGNSLCSGSSFWDLWYSGCRRNGCWPLDVCSSRAGGRQAFYLCNETETSLSPSMGDVGSPNPELFSWIGAYYSASVVYLLHTGSGAQWFLLLWLLLGLNAVFYLWSSGNIWNREPKPAFPPLCFPGILSQQWKADEHRFPQDVSLSICKLSQIWKMVTSHTPVVPSFSTCVGVWRLAGWFLLYLHALF